MNKLRYIGYVRKSTEDEERQVLSKEAQRDKVRERFGDLNIVDVLDESKSAFEPDKRPVFASILKMIDDGEIDGIVAWHPDRLSRNELDASAITYRVRKGVLKDLKFASFTFDNSPEGMMMLQMTMSQSQYFSAKLSKDVKRGNETKRKNGGLTGRAPEGYLNVNSKVVADPERFHLIRKAFDLFLTGEHSVLDIHRIMTDEWGYRTLKRGKTGGGKLIRSTLYNVFRNVRYAGLVPDPNDPDRFYEANFPAMITRDEYDRVQVLLGRKGMPRLTSRKQFALRGFIRCGDCGCSITAQSKRKQLKSGKVNIYNYYHCTGRRDGCTQKSIYVKEDDLFDQLLSLLDEYELTPKMYEWAMNAFREFAEQEADERNAVQDTQTKAIHDVQTQLDRLLDMATRDLIDDGDYKLKSTSLKTELKQLQEEQADTALRVKNWYETGTRTFDRLLHACEKFTDGDLADKRDILLAIGENPTLLDGKLQITPNKWLIPIKKSARGIRADLMKVRTLPQQMQEASEMAVMSTWQGH